MVSKHNQPDLSNSDSHIINHFQLTIIAIFRLTKSNISIPLIPRIFYASEVVEKIDASGYFGGIGGEF